MLSRKSIVLNGIEERCQKAVLTLECDGETSKGQIRLYNFGVEPKGIMSLGIYYDGAVVKAGLTHVGGMVYAFKSQISVLPKDFSCAIINFVDGEPKPILYGNSDGYRNEKDIFEEVISTLSQAENLKEVEQILDEKGIDFDEELKEEINEEIEKCFNLSDCKDCQNCQYKKYYLDSIKVLNQESSEKSEKEEEKYNYYSEIKGQIDKLFENNPNEEYLEGLIPNSKWIKVELENSEDFYVLGLIYEDEELVYICYGVPGVYQKMPPRELSGYPVWFALDEENPHGFGYWLSYQDAQSGESVKAVVV